MQIAGRFAGIFALAIGTCAPAYALPAMDFARHAEINEAALSPDGRHVALAVPSADGLETQLQVVPLDGGTGTRVLRFGRLEHVSDVIWTSDTQLVLARARNMPLRRRPYSIGQLMTSDIAGRNQDVLFGYLPEVSKVAARRKDQGFAEVAAVLDAEPGVLLVSFKCWDCGEDPDTVIYRVDSLTGNRREVERAPGAAWFIFDRNGRARVRTMYDRTGMPVLAYRPQADDDWSPMPTALAGYSIGEGRFDADNDLLHASVSDRGEPSQLHALKLGAGTRTRLAGRDDVDVAYYQYAGRNGLPFAVVHDAGKPSVQYVDPGSEWAALHAGLMQSFPGHLVRFLDVSRDGTKVLFAIHGDRQPGAYYLYDRTAKKAQLVAETMPWLKPAQLAPMQSVSFANRDGVVLNAFYTANGDGPRPLVVIPHGGPHGVYDRWGYDADAQFLASRGYGVLQVNFRGSGGRGQMFERAGYREWGRGMMDDIADGVRWAIAQKLADPARICTFGASFGGYAALMQPIRNPGLYRCAAGYAGVYDLTVMLKAGDIPDTRDGRRYLERVLGSDPATLIADSPARNVERIGVPVFLAQGSIDTRVPMDQFNAMRRAFPAETRVETLVAAGEGHGFYKPSNRAELYTRLEGFLSRNLAPPGE